MIRQFYCLVCIMRLEVCILGEEFGSLVLMSYLSIQCNVS